MNTFNTPDRPNFVKQQYAFAAYIRDPARNPTPHGIEERRMKIYSELFYNNVEKFIANTYPVLRSILPDAHWHTIIRDYFAHHQSHTPLFPEMPREFLKYLENERSYLPEDPPFMLELAHYEWVELALSIMDEQVDEKVFNVQGNLLTGIPVVSPLVRVLNYRFPVHRISPEFQPQTAGEQETQLIVYRDSNDTIHFIEANPVTARLLQLIIDNENDNGQALLTQIVTELNHPQPDTVVKGGYEIMQDFMGRGILLGTRI